MTLTASLMQHQQALLAALAQGDSEALDARLPQIRSADLADILEQMLEDEAQVDSALALLKSLPMERQASVFGHLPNDAQDEMAGRVEDAWLSRILDKMGSDERADLFKVLGDDRKEALLRRMARREREALKRLASYEEGTAGALMTADYVAIPMGLTVSRAMMRVRQTAPDAETVYQLYVVDEQGRLARHHVVASADGGTAPGDHR